VSCLLVFSSCVGPDLLGAAVAAAAPPPALRLAGRAPDVAVGPDGAVHLAFVAPVSGEEGGEPRVHYARWTGELAGPFPVSPPGEEIHAHGEMTPTVEVLPGGGVRVSYVVARPGRWNSELTTQRSGDGGVSWTPPARVHSDAELRSHSFFDTAVGTGGRAFFAWLDSRGGQQGLYAAVLDTGPPAGVSGGVSGDVSGGVSGDVSGDVTVDAVTCQCCRTAVLAARDGRVWLAYRDLEEEDLRDIAVAVSEDGGRSYRRRGLVHRDGWRLDGCPDSGPRLAEDRQRRVWATWFSGRGPGIYAAPIGAAGEPVLVAPGAPGEAHVSRPEIGLLPDGRLLVLYETAAPGTGPEVHARIGDPDTGRWGPAFTFAEAATSPRFASGAGIAVVAVERRRDPAGFEVLPWSPPESPEAVGALGSVPRRP
jgi:hypothetical protein